MELLVRAAADSLTQLLLLEIVYAAHNLVWQDTAAHCSALLQKSKTFDTVFLQTVLTVLTSKVILSSGNHLTQNPEHN